MDERGRELFFEVSDLPPAERREALDRIASEDRVLSAELSSLLTARDRSFDFLDRRPEFHLEDEPVPEPSIPGYEVVSRLGEGGFGVVFHARQREPIERDVAIKVLRPERLGEHGAARFAAEQQILAGLNHPHIATIHDAGRTEDGVPFAVLEWIDGEPITEWCDRQRATIDERIRLFLKVCAAVEFAHRHGVIHGDLKPNNILVTRDGGDATPKVIDFGLARTIDPGLGATASKLERFRSMAGTPAYMAPEQARSDSRGVDARMDVYGLGALLSELLSGAPAFEPQVEASVSRTLHLVRGARPTPPSERVASSSEFGRHRLALRRGARPTGFARSLRGDLDAIVAKAAANLAEDRYRTVSELAQDLERRARGLPVEARSGEFGYAVLRFTHRRRRELSALGLFTVLVVFGLRSLQDSDRRARRAEEQRDAATEEAAISDRLSRSSTEFLASLLTAPRPERFGVDVRVTELLGDADSQLEDRFGDQPRIVGELSELIGSTLRELGESERAIESLRRAVEAHELAGRSQDRLRALGELALAALGADRPELARKAADRLVASSLAGQSKQALLVQARVELAFGRAERALEWLDMVDDAIDDSTAWLRVQILTALDRREDAEKVLDGHFADRARGAASLSLADARAAVYVAQAEIDRGRPDVGLRLLEDVEAWQSARLPLLHAQRTQTRFAKAFCLRALDRDEEAFAEVEEILGDHERGLAPDHPTGLRARSFAARFLYSSDRRQRSHELFASIVATIDRSDRIGGLTHVFDRVMALCTAVRAEPDTLREAVELVELDRSLSDRDRRLLDQALSTALWREGAREDSIAVTRGLAERAATTIGLDSGEFLRARRALASRVFESEGLEAAGVLVEETRDRISAVVPAEHTTRREAEFAYFGYLRESGQLDDYAEAKTRYADALAARAEVEGRDPNGCVFAAAWLLSEPPITDAHVEAAAKLCQGRFEGKLSRVASRVLVSVAMRRGEWERAGQLVEEVLEKIPSDRTEEREATEILRRRVEARTIVPQSSASQSSGRRRR